MSDKITCRHCKWTTDRKHFGFIQTEENIKKFGANHICMVCYMIHPSKEAKQNAYEETENYYSKQIEIEWEGFDADWIC